MLQDIYVLIVDGQKRHTGTWFACAVEATKYELMGVFTLRKHNIVIVPLENLNGHEYKGESDDN